MGQSVESWFFDLGVIQQILMNCKLLTNNITVSRSWGGIDNEVVFFCYSFDAGFGNNFPFLMEVMLFRPYAPFFAQPLEGVDGFVRNWSSRPTNNIINKRSIKQYNNKWCTALLQQLAFINISRPGLINLFVKKADVFL